MKLYNLYQSVILEEIEKNLRLITEGVSTDDVKVAINGEKLKNGVIGRYNVNIVYKDNENQPPSRRYIQIYVYGQTISGNDAIRAYQIDGGSATVRNGWKIFRLDKIESWIVTKKLWTKPVSDYDPSISTYNKNGDLTFGKIYQQVQFNSLPNKDNEINKL